MSAKQIGEVMKPLVDRLKGQLVPVKCPHCGLTGYIKPGHKEPCLCGGVLIVAVFEREIRANV